MSLLIFTNLDGSLLDHESHSWKGAVPALTELRRRAVPLILVTGRTRAEVERLQRQLGLEEPFVAENGGGIFFPRAYSGFRIPGAKRRRGRRVIALGKTYAEVRSFVAREGDRLGIRGFGDLSVAEVAQLTGLPRIQAALALRREFTEPFVLEDPTRLPDLEEDAGRAGLRVLQGGRFLHLTGAGQGRGEAVRRLIGVFRENGFDEIRSVGLGSGEGDLPMLRSVDVPVVIPGPALHGLEFERGWIAAPEPGSAGWNRAVLGLLEGASA